MILDHKKIVIFSYPRTATKLIANTLAELGYHNYGEWYNIWSNKISGNTSALMSPSEQSAVRQEEAVNPARYFTKQCHLSINRVDQWKNTDQQLNPECWSLTLWPNNLVNFPFILDVYKDCHWLCPTRNRWTQLLSWFIHNQNKGLGDPLPVNVTRMEFEKSYWQLRRTEIIQQWILKNYSSTEVPFEGLVTGTFLELGKDCSANSEEERNPAILEKLIINIDEVKSWFAYAETLTF